MTRSNADRRTFLKTAAAATTFLAAKSYARVPGANDRIAVGLIGCGNRGHGAHLPGLTRHAEAENVEVTAVCDVWSKHRRRAAETATKTFGSAPFEASDFRAVLDRKDVDAVMIASCDFQHAGMLREAAAAKKDAYCEKPLSMDLDELKSVRRAVVDAELVVQIGTQRRSEPLMRGARQVVQSGTLGEVSRIEFFRNANRPNWYKRLAWLPIPESEVDWKQFLMHRPMRPFNDQLLAGWYGYREFCGGSIGQFMSHYADLVNFLTGSTFPRSAVAHGATLIWEDDYAFDCRDQVQVSMIYPEGFLFTYATNFGNGSGSRSVMYGNKGTLDLTGKPFVSAAGAYGQSNIGEDQNVEPIDCPDHFANWLQCLRSREQPAASIEAGYQHSVACIMADRAMLSGRRQTYDAATDQIVEG